MHSSLFAPQEHFPPAPPSSPASEAGGGPSLLHKRRVVIVEDEGVTQVHLQRICKRSGMLVSGFASNAQEGIETVLRERPDIVLMDIKMPGKKNGLDAAEEILAVYPVCVVMLTAYVDTEHTERAHQIGTHGYVVKPVYNETLLPQLAEAFARFQRLRAETKKDD